MEYIQKSKKLAEKFDHLFFDIVNSSPLSIIITDKDRKIVYVKGTSNNYQLIHL